MKSLSRCVFLMVVLLSLAACGDEKGGAAGEQDPVPDAGADTQEPSEDLPPEQEDAEPQDADEPDPEDTDGPDEPDMDEVDTGQPDADEPDLPPDDQCDLSAKGDENKDRVVLIGHPFAQEVGQQGTTLTSMTLRATGELVRDGVRLDVGVRVGRIEFVPSGQFALVLGERDELISLRVDGAGALTEVGRVELPGADYGDIVMMDNGRTAFIVGSNVNETSGISVVNIGCDGSIELLSEAFFNLRLTRSMALRPGQQSAVLLGGQTAFEPIDDDDLRLLERDGDGWRQTGAFDIFGDFIDAERIGLSPDGQLLLIPNGSVFSEEGSQVSVVAIEGDGAREVNRLTDLPDAREARFSPDGQSAIVTLLEPGRVAVLRRDGLNMVLVEEIRGIGLPEQIAAVERGDLSGLVLLSSVDPQGGPNIAMLRFEGPGQVVDMGQVDLSEDFEDIPGPITVQP